MLPLSFGIWSPYGSSELVGSHLYATSGCHWCLALYPYGWASSLCLRPLFAPGRYRRVSWSLSDVPLCSRSFRMGFEPLSEVSLRALPLPVRFSWWSSLRQRVFGSSWLSPLFFPIRWYGYMTTCIALDPVRRLSFLLGPISFWMGFNPLSETSLRACRCRRVYWWSSRRPRGFESSGLSPVFFPFRGPTPVSRRFLCLRPSRSCSPFPSLAPSWWGLCPLWRRALLMLSCYVLSVPSTFFFASVSFVDPVRIVAPLAPCLGCHFPSFARSRSCGWGVSPCVGFRQSPWGSRWLHLYRLTPDLVRIQGLAVRPLGLWSVFTAFTCETFRKFSRRLFIQFN